MLVTKGNRRRLGEEARQPLGYFPLKNDGGVGTVGAAVVQGSAFMQLVGAVARRVTKVQGYSTTLADVVGPARQREAN